MIDEAVKWVFKLGVRARDLGFAWKSKVDAIEKLEEECRELKEALLRWEQDPRQVDDELGDVLMMAFRVVFTIGRDPEMLLKSAVKKFDRRLKAVAAKADKYRMNDPASMQIYWNEVKKEEKSNGA